MNDNLSDLGFSIFVGFVSVLAFLIGIQVGESTGYKQGQLDFQRGQVEWLLVGPDEIHHIQKEK